MYNAFNAFVAAPIFDGKEQIGVVAFRMPHNEINLIMTNNNAWESMGFGQTGETYLVGSDYTIRNQPRYLTEHKEQFLNSLYKVGFNNTQSKRMVDLINRYNSAIGLYPVRTTAGMEAIEGISGNKIINNTFGETVLSAYKPLEINGVKWGIISEINMHEAFAPIEQPAATAMAPGASQPLPPEMMGMVPGAAPAAGSQMVAGPGQFSRRTDLAQGGTPQMSQLLAALTGAA